MVRWIGFSLVLAWMDHTEVNDVITFPRKGKLHIMYEYLCSNWPLIEQQLQIVLTNQYLHPHPTPKPHDEFDLRHIFSMSEGNFCQVTRPTKSGFIILV
ncbi:hypothetical protein VP01_3427g1 [Puccinia sorghi]|uniref:Uncharacterized protein n=1 Tax=Puccinia sorghi TaxID=27349 RepID=A0A0L6UXC4_9BASI|nr:hypothetical protein VP01_3427g1 [Puccinia sorghi]